jgi:hypothetical protein
MRATLETVLPQIARWSSAAFLLTLSGCAPGPAPEPVRAALNEPELTEPSELKPSELKSSEFKSCRPDRALLAPQPAPDCAFRRSDLKTLDPDLWARLKIEYERECYQTAERVARKRLRLLQAANRCEPPSASGQ